MIAELESALVERLGSDLPPPFRGRTERAPGVAAPGPGPRLVVGCVAASPVVVGVGTPPLEIVPGDAGARRVVHLRCRVEVRVVPAAAGDRAQQIAALDAVTYLVDGPAYATGRRLRPDDEDADPGFLLEHLSIDAVTAAFDPLDPDAAPAAVTCVATGWFWPVGVREPDGTLIDRALLQLAAVPVDVVLDPAIVSAGGATSRITIRVPSLATLSIDADGTEPFTSDGLIVWLEAPGGRPGRGTLAGGAAVDEPAGARRIVPVDGAVALDYTPPAERGREELVAAFDRSDGPVVELTRHRIEVRA